MDSSSAEQHEYYPPPPQQAYYSTSTTHLSDHPTLHTPQHSQPQPQHLGPQQDFAPVYSPQSEYDAEADLKRLRNTAASARFRAKKKQREQTLEMQAREKKTALEKLEARIQELERENRFLKGLIMGPREEELKVCFFWSSLPVSFSARFVFFSRLSHRPSYLPEKGGKEEQDKKKK
ncbi:unnamed protein product [Diplocarpon coronariae]